MVRFLEFLFLYRLMMDIDVFGGRVVEVIYEGIEVEDGLMILLLDVRVLSFLLRGI